MKTLALLTPLYLSRLKSGPKEYTTHDAGCDGLALRVHPSGSRAWITWHREAAQTRRITLGHYPAMSLEDARRACWATRSTGGDGRELIRARTITFATLAERFLIAKSGLYRPLTLSSLRAYLDSQLLPAFGNLPVGQITTRELGRWFHAYSRARPGGANQALGHFGTILNWGKANGHLPRGMVSPGAAIRRNRRHARGRMLSSDQLAALGRALAEAPPRQKQGATALLLILLTGCRMGEVLGLSWQDVRPDRLALAQAKTGPRDVWLSDLAKDVLAGLRKDARGDLLFPKSNDPNHPLSTLSCWPALRRKAGLPDDIRIHDLRHTYASHALLAGESLPITGALIGHKSTKSTARYAHLDPGQVMRAAEAVQRQIDEWIGG